jgi:hypothetical protein
MSSTPSYNAQYQDSISSMIDNDYAPLMGPVSCPLECTTDYSNPSSAVECPSACNYYDIYSNLSNMYDTYIPSATRSRLIPSGSVTTDFTVYNPQITNFAGNVSDADLKYGSVLSKAQSLSNIVDQAQYQASVAVKQYQIAANAAATAAETARNNGPAAASVHAMTASNAADTAAGAAAAVTGLANQVSMLAKDIIQLGSSAPSNAIQQAVTVANNANAIVSEAIATAKQAADSAAAAAASANQNANKPQEAFRFLRRRQQLSYTGNRLRQRSRSPSRIQFAKNRIMM